MIGSIKFQALMCLFPNGGWLLREDELEWLDENQTQPTTEEISAEMLRIQAEYDANEYSRLRKAEYDKLNQYELIGNDSIDGTTTHKDAILAIKAKYPKTV